MTALHVGHAPDWLDVSRETLDRLTLFVALVEKWNSAINLVAKRSLADAWERHVLDSAQLMRLCPEKARTWVDFGSGAGFPGVVIAAIAKETKPELHVTLVESDKRKAAFLMQAARQMDLTLSVVAVRAEMLAPCVADVVSARALAPLAELCGLAARHLKPEGLAIFPKGAQADAEVEAAMKLWHFDRQSVQSRTDPSGCILTMKNIRHV